MLELGKGSREECGRHDEGLASSQGRQRFSSESVPSREKPGPRRPDPRDSPESPGVLILRPSDLTHDQ